MYQNYPLALRERIREGICGVHKMKVVCVWVCNRLQLWTFSINITIQRGCTYYGGQSMFLNLVVIEGIMHHYSRLEDVYDNVYVRGCQNFHPRLIDSVLSFVSSVLLLQTCTHTFTHRYMHTHHLLYVLGWRWLITRMCVCVCVCVCVRLCELQRFWRH